MADNGYVYAFRRAWSHPAFLDLLDGAIWNYLYQNAAWQDTAIAVNGHSIPIKRGQIFVTYRSLAAGFCCGEKRIRRLTDGLSNAAMVDADATHRGVLITIRNYDKYQRPPEEADAQQPHPAPQMRRTNGRTSNKDKGKEGNKDTGVHPAFEALWQTFPKKRTGNKAKAFAAWKRACQRDTAATIQAGADAYARSDDVARGFEKGLEAWLNDDRWKVPYQPAKPQFSGRRGFCP